jgi:hypothetical protein
MAAVLACGSGTALAFGSGAAVLEIGHERGVIEVTVPLAKNPHAEGVRVHRTTRLHASDLTSHHGIPVTSPLRTLLDLATYLPHPQLERAINEADKRDLIDPEALRAALDDRAGEPGVRALREMLDRHAFTLTDSQLEQVFVPLARAAGLSPPDSGVHLNGFKVDFFWPDLGLVVETDGLRYHRTPIQQARDRLRDQAHTAAGLTQLRFSHSQIRYEPTHVQKTLAVVARRLTSGA